MRTAPDLAGSEAAKDQAAASGSISEQLTDRSQQLPMAHGRFSRAIVRRHMGIVVVPICPLCSHLHIHRVPVDLQVADDIVKEAGCLRGQYVVRIAIGDAVPAEASAVSR